MMITCLAIDYDWRPRWPGVSPIELNNASVRGWGQGRAAISVVTNLFVVVTTVAIVLARVVALANQTGIITWMKKLN